MPAPRSSEEGFDFAEIWEDWQRPAPPLDLDRDTARMYELRFPALTHYQRIQHARAWQYANAAAVLGLATNPGPVPGNLLSLSWSWAYGEATTPDSNQRDARGSKNLEVASAVLDLYVSQQGNSLPDSLYLGLRAARRALHVNNKDPQTYKLLAACYQRLLDQPQERELPTFTPQLANLRRMQIVTAMQNCLRSLPQPLPKTAPEMRMASDAHVVLYVVFEQMGYKEMLKYHLSETIRILQATVPTSSKMQDEIQKLLNDAEGRLVKLKSELDKEQDEYVLAVQNRPPLDRIRIALDRNLAETAWKEFNRIEPEETRTQAGQYIVRRMMDLLLNLGWLDEAEKLINPSPESTVGLPVSPEYLDLRLRLAAARGDYEEADRLLADALNNAWHGPRGETINTGNQFSIAAMIGRVLLMEAMHATGVPRLPWVPNERTTMQGAGQSASDFWVRRWRMETITYGLSVQKRRCEWQLLRGWLALESGHCVEARKHFLSALEEQVPENRWYPEILRLNAMVEIPNQPSPERRQLDSIRGQVRFYRNFAEFYLLWLNKSQS